MVAAGSRFAIEAVELPVLLRSDNGDGRLISQFVKAWLFPAETNARRSSPVL